MSEINYDVKMFWTEENRQKYENAMNHLISKIKSIDDACVKKADMHMIRHIEKRLKTPESIKEKLKRKNKPGDDIEKELNDLAGVRVICFDMRQVYFLVEKIREWDQITVLKEKDYIAKPKSNGYQSYHMIIVDNGVKVELQLRTILMDAWSSLETILVYKKRNLPSKEILDKIHKFSKWSRKMDQMIEEIYEGKGQKK